MTAEPNRVEAIFAAALEKVSLQERTAYLDEACAGDAELRQRVESLLAAHDDAGSFLEKPAAAEGLTTDASGEIDRAAPAVVEGPGTRIGPYKLLQQIGEGGMGVVFMAEQQEPIRRMVALKIIKPGMDSAQVVARFEAERQALALMDHPNIARVFDGGQVGPVCRTGPDAEGPARQAGPTGRPYFVMELVKGIPITRFCDDNRLTPRERLGLFVCVCHAVQHAHQKGIIHRDIKPSNVLVALYDGVPVPKVIDFGVAKALHQKLTERTLFTAFGAMVGTLEYMSPEQAELNALDVDTRSDVYSLGVLLYELLTGSTPLQRDRLRKAAYTEILRLIRDEETPRPSNRLSGSGTALSRISAQRKTEPAQLARLVRGELDLIVMKSLEKERGRRYETANGLARDVEHYLNDEPVEACPPSVGYRVRKFARKNRGVLSTAGAFAVLLVVAAAVSLWLAVAARRAEGIAEEKREAADVAQREASDERNRANKEAELAKANAAETRRALDRMMVAKGIQLAEEGRLFDALPWFVKPLEREEEMTPEERRVHRTRIACYLRHSPGRPTLRQVFFPEGPVSHAAWSADAKRVLTVSGKVVQVWDVRSGASLARLRHPAFVTTAIFTTDSTRIVAAAGPVVYTWDVRNQHLVRPGFVDWGALLQEPLTVMPHSPLQLLGNIRAQRVVDGEWRHHDGSLTIGRDGRRVLFAYRRNLRLLDLETGKLIGQWVRGKDWLYRDHALSPDGDRLPLVRDGRASIHDTATGKTAERIIDHGSPVEYGNFSPDGTRALTFGKDGAARVWDARTWQPLAQIGDQDSHHRTLCEFSSDNRLVACWGFWLSGIRDLAWWDVESGRLVREISGGDLTRFSWRPDGQQLLVASYSKIGEVALWNASPEWSIGPLLPHSSPISAVVYAPDGRTLLTATEDGEARIWDFCDRSLNEPVTLKAPGKDEFSSDIRLQATGRGGWGTARPFLLTAGETRLAAQAGLGGSTRPDVERICRLLPPGTQFTAAAFSPDQSRVITFQDSPTVPGAGGQLWDSRSGQRVGKPLDSKLHSKHGAPSLIYVTFSPDSRLFVTAGGDGIARLWNARTGDPVGQVLGHDGWVVHAAFSPDSQLLVTCSSDHTARLWRTQTCQPASERLRHGNFVALATFSPSGQIVATVSEDGTVRLWDVGLGTPVGVMEYKNGIARDIGFNSNGSLLLVSFDDRIRIWDVASQQEVSPPVKASLNQGIAGFDRHFGLKFSGDDRVVVGPFVKRAVDLTPDNRSASDLVKLGHLYSGRRLDPKGGAAPLRWQELQALWRELREKYQGEFAVAPKAVVEWRTGQLKSIPKLARPAQIAFGRRWLANELAELDWQPGEQGNEKLRVGDYLERLYVLALHRRESEAAAAADSLAARWQKHPNTLYNCACVHSLAACAVKGDAPLVDRYATRAVAHIRQAVAAGYNDGEHIRKDPDLDALRQRKDFILLQRDLAGKR